MGTSANDNAAAILAVIARVPRGRVTTYGSVAVRAGLPGRARLVGKILRDLPAGNAIPWHRILAAGGRIALPEGSPSRQRQIERLQDEGVLVTRGRVDLGRHGWSAVHHELDRLLWGGEQ
jgi:methylated-DNA-protein-cysteine methyltransferase-like protein